MITLNGKEADLDVTNSLARNVTEIHVDGHWLAEFSCYEDATEFVSTIEYEGRAYKIENNKVTIDE